LLTMPGFFLNHGDRRKSGYKTRIPEPDMGTVKLKRDQTLRSSKLASLQNCCRSMLLSRVRVNLGQRQYRARAYRRLFKFLVDLPGVRAEDIAIALSDGTLTVYGEKTGHKSEGERHMRERRIGVFRRSLTLPSVVSENG
jgi:hypothetical protein